jgi:hypothetical protein
MRIIIACEQSAAVRDAFRARGHDAWSCDILPSEGDPRWHIQGDAIAAVYSQTWDLLVGHPPCTFLSNSSSKHLYVGMKLEGGCYGDRWALMGAAAGFFLQLWNAPIKKIALENPIMLNHPKRIFGIPEQTQVIQPWMFGHPESKSTCLWLKGLPELKPTNDVKAEMDLLPIAERHRVHHMPPGPERQKERSRTYSGIAWAMADQWGSDLVETFDF